MYVQFLTGHYDTKIVWKCVESPYCEGIVRRVIPLR